MRSQRLWVYPIPDKRGSESSEGDRRTSWFQDLATDAEAAIDFLKHNHPNLLSVIGVLGASQGGQIAPIVASSVNELSFVINIVGSAVPFHDALVFEENNNIRELGLLPGFSDAVARVSSCYIRNVSQRAFWDKIGNYDPLPFLAAG